MKSNVPKDLGMTAEQRKKLDADLEEESKRLDLLPPKPRPAPPAPPPEAPPQPPVASPTFFEEVQRHQAELAFAEGLTEIHPEASKRGPAATSWEIARVVVGDDRRAVKEQHVLSLMASILDLSLMHPIVITLAGRLVDGAHRLEACRRLGWTEIPVTVKLYDAIQGELAMLDANLCRNELNALERAEALSRRMILYLQLHPVTKHGGAPGKAGGGKVAVPKDAAVASFAEDTAVKTGMGKRTIQDDTKIIKKLPKDLRDRIRCSPLADNRSELLKLTRIADKDDQRRVALLVIDGKAKHVVDAERILRTEKRRAEIAEHNAEAAKLEAGEGPPVYGVILADVPWRYERRLSKSRDIENNYDSMPTADLAEIPVGDIAAMDCILFFWSPPSKVAEACAIIAAWGFDVRTCMCWDKMSVGPGIWVRQQFELLIIAVKGTPGAPLEADRPASVVSLPRGEHSEKPEVFYEIIERCYPVASKVELFARKRRPGWRSLGNEIDGSDISIAIADIVKRAGQGTLEPEVPRADDLPSATEPAQDSATAPASPPQEAA